MKYGYCRVSTVGQDLKEQENALVALGVPKANIFKEKISGVIRSDDRPQFGKLLKKIQAGDELVVMKLDRLGRSTLDILTVIQNLRGQGIAITIEGVGTIRDDMMGSLTMNLLASFAEFERALIIDRTQSGRKRAMANGVRMGRKEKLSSQAQNAIKRRYGSETGKSLANEYGVGLRTIQRIASAA
ncbi:recombinase family protein [Gluconobacter cerinus]|uniref:recombinase family protein n=1 Tax=Gluconobacter cerinus TaxID=38307 RepID=UPI001B8BA43D|nr:recombinase family protein [Gluconobacter cerinus]MBS1069867.1 recombinase family protein [Gluconobacter cerinus]